jgi:tRNA (guanine-N7-)-methyltransferase
MQPTTKEQPESARILPGDWLHPLPPECGFDSAQPLEIDLGAGKGRFLLARAAHHPDVNFLGIERMLRRVRKLDRKVRHQGLRNVRLLRMEAYYATTYLIPSGAVSTYYIFFPDPWPKKRHHGNRLFSPLFVDAMHRTLASEGRVHIATDHRPYFEEIQEILCQDPRFNRTEPYIPSEDEQTDFECYYAQHTEICRCSIQRGT